MNIIENLTLETRTELLKRPTAFKAYIACLETGLDALGLYENTEICKYYACGPKAVFDNRELINKALEEMRGN